MNITRPSADQRTFDIEKWVRFSDEKATVTEIIITEHSSIAAWGVRPGQEVPPHTHPDGQDTWIMMRGELTYFLGDNRKKTIRAGQVDVADKNQVNGATNESAEDAVFLSISSAPKLGLTAAKP
jgi:quercetin dioxygenase-like cupin family protein